MRLQDLPRPLARRCLDVPRFCRTVLGTDIRGATLVVAYSTGLDSSALLRILHLLRPSQNLCLVAAHAHHGLRPESDQEETHALRVCAQLDIACETTRLDVPAHLPESGRGAEEKARQMRYAFLEDVRRRYQADWVVTAHHGNDLMEDVIMRLLRGTGWPGLGGMPGIDAQRRLLRPLLAWNKDEFPELMQAVSADWKEDPSNDDTALTRNRIRHDIMPLLQRENPALLKNILHLWRLAAADSAYWAKRTQTFRDHADFIPGDTLSGLESAARLRLYKCCLDSLGHGQILANHLFALDEAWAAGKWDTQIQFPGHKIAIVSRQGIAFQLRSRV